MKLPAVLALMALGACTPGIYRAPVRQPNYYSVNPDGSRSDKYSRINQWTSYGPSGLGMQSAVVAAYERAQHAPPPAAAVTVYNAAFPPGVSFERGMVIIEQDSPYVAVGRFEIGYWQQTAPHESEVEEDLRRLASVTQADTVVVEIERVEHADDRVRFMTGIVLRRRGPVSVATPTKAPQRVEAQLVYRARGEGCLSREDFADEVSARIGYSPWRAGAPRTLDAEIICGTLEYRATISIPGAAPRRLTAASCTELTEAVVTVVVVQLDETMNL